jgi:4-hydroxy-tetrahydrodipicolinate reductase
MIKICMAGACGRMGRRILEMAAADEDAAIGGAFDLPDRAGEKLEVGHESGNAQEVTLAASAEDAIKNADALIDFTFADVCLANVRAATAAGKPSIIGTTGLSNEQRDELEELAKQVAIVYAPNMSPGVNLLFKLTREAAKVLGLDYNVEITEIHHNKKKDSPSGTAKRLGEIAAEEVGLDYDNDTAHGREGMVGERPKREIGMHALRGGDVIGEHVVHFIGQGERIELAHKSNTRDHYARGAIRAARFAAKAKPGLYDMQDVLGLK